MNAKHDGGLIKFMHFSNRLCFYGIGLIGVLFLVAYHASVTLFPFDSDLLPISATLFALIAILFFSIDRTMESQAREIEIANRFRSGVFRVGCRRPSSRLRREKGPYASGGRENRGTEGELKVQNNKG